ncbi:MAG: BON domain-containing protein, partial [Geminicoccales bacterium]
PYPEARRAVSDMEIARAVETKIRSDQAIPADSVTIIVWNGFVQLGGAVGNLLAKERAASVAETVEGVEAVTNKIVVLPSPSISRRDILEDIETALITGRAVESGDVKVSVAQDGRVTLTGTVQSPQEQRLAGTVAKSVRGVTALENRLSVQVADVRPNMEIRNDVLQRLKWDALVSHALITVGVSHGMVTLSGAVGTAAEKRRAVEDAWVAGVRHVEASQLNVEPWANRSLRSGGTATLRGSTEALARKRALGSIAGQTVDIRDVVDRIEVRPSGDAGGEDLVKRVRRALERSPSLEADDISVNETDGAVQLYGLVDTTYQKARANQAAGQVPGVVAVENHIEVRRGRPLDHERYIWGSPYFELDQSEDLPAGRSARDK